MVIARQRSERGEDDQSPGADVADGMQDSRRSERGGAGRDSQCFVTHVNLGFAFEDHVQFVLPGVSVRGVLLAGLETVETGEESFAAEQIGLPHFFGRKFGEVSGAWEDHMDLSLAGNGQADSRRTGQTGGVG